MPANQRTVCVIRKSLCIRDKRHKRYPILTTVPVSLFSVAQAADHERDRENIGPGSLGGGVQDADGAGGGEVGRCPLSV